MRKPMVAGNWKMNGTAREACELVRRMLPQLEAVSGIEKVLFPPYTALYPVAAILNGSSVALGAQNMHYAEKGAFTGEVSPGMLAGLCRFVILGHSERRHIFGEASQFINQKVKAALNAALTPIVCVGERLEENESGQTADVILRQLTASLDDITSGAGIVVAYEPVWAIGTGRAASAAQAEDTLRLIRNMLGKIFDRNTADDMTLLYGGSVTSANIVELMHQPQIDGVLVGGASLKPDEFCDIARQAACIKGCR
jgi:triosephosphate isomerase